MKQYEADLERNLRALVDRLQRQSRRPGPSLRKQIPNGDGKMRPRGIACVEDKLVQRALVMILEPNYERDFLPCSFGVNDNRSWLALAYRWIGRRSQKGRLSHVPYEQYLVRHPLAEPRRLADLIARGRRRSSRVEMM